MLPLLLNTAYLPPVIYMAACKKVSGIRIEIMETYRKQTCRNHCLIGGPNGTQTLTIPVVKVNGNHTLTRDIRISNHQPWQKIHWRSIQTAYNNSPFFLYYMDDLAPVYEKQVDFLKDFNLVLLEQICRMLKMNLQFNFTDDFKKSPEGSTDCRETLVSGKFFPQEAFEPYTQVFSPSHGFMPNLSILDLLCNLGPGSQAYLDKVNPF